MSGAGGDPSKVTVGAAMVASAVVVGPLVIAVVARMLLFAINPRGLELPGYELEVAVVFAMAFALAVLAVALVFRRLSAVAGRQALRIPSMVLAVQVAGGAVAATVLLFTP